MYKTHVLWQSPATLKHATACLIFAESYSMLNRTRDLWSLFGLNSEGQWPTPLLKQLSTHVLFKKPRPDLWTVHFDHRLRIRRPHNHKHKVRWTSATAVIWKTRLGSVTISLLDSGFKSSARRKRCKKPKWESTCFNRRSVLNERCSNAISNGPRFAFQRNSLAATVAMTALLCYFLKQPTWGNCTCLYICSRKNVNFLGGAWKCLLLKGDRLLFRTQPGKIVKWSNFISVTSLCG